MTELIKVTEAAKIFRVDDETIRRWLNSGKLHGIKVGWEWRIKQSDIDEILGINAESPSG